MVQVMFNELLNILVRIAVTLCANARMIFASRSGLKGTPKPSMCKAYLCCNSQS
jgi:hypothetical protein